MEALCERFAFTFERGCTRADAEDELGALFAECVREKGECHPETVFVMQLLIYHRLNDSKPVQLKAFQDVFDLSKRALDDTQQHFYFIMHYVQYLVSTGFGGKAREIVLPAFEGEKGRQSPWVVWSMAKVDSVSGRVDEAMDLLKECETQDDIRWIGCFGLLGSIYQEKEEFELAVDAFQTALDFFIEFSPKHHQKIAGYHFCIAINLLAQDKDEDARPHIVSALELYRAYLPECKQHIATLEELSKL